MAGSRILVTGAAGAIGTVVVEALRRRGHAVRGFDRGPCPGLADHHRGDLVDAAAVRAACAGIDVVVHLAATPDRADFATDLVPNNVIGLHHLFTAAREARVARMVTASTVRVAALHGWGGRTVRVADGFAPHDDYSLTKACGEVMAEMHARQGAFTAIAARIAWFLRNPREAAELRAHPDGADLYLSHDDAARFFACAVEAEPRFPGAVRYAAMFVASRPARHRSLDLSDARDVLGFEPLDTWPQGTPAGVVGEP
jgi:nucleoside-diphosphate-sugar epimerase